MEYPLKKYGVWYFNPKGYEYDTSKCAEEVSPSKWIMCQCSRKNGHGDRGLFCKQHAKKHPEK